MKPKITKLLEDYFQCSDGISWGYGNSVKAAFDNFRMNELNYKKQLNIIAKAINQFSSLEQKNFMNMYYPARAIYYDS